jgi:hypothetical protein
MKAPLRHEDPSVQLLVLIWPVVLVLVLVAWGVLTLLSAVTHALQSAGLS